ncbi:hypothetical protein [Streptomyces melanogenes]|uniref:hypothetical protein n=1 Tax=Streptomyces melanogenes TaxID=67326 RepID=UPI00167CF717|nr:hypothetical protein [Streptomyces melanogenes]GGP96131.1 hypothetical protein GCM10010278_87050 [Streptomyces melanogenes]
MTHPLLRAALRRMAEFPDGQGAGFSADCLADGCGWSQEVTADFIAAHTVLEDHALESGHTIFNTVVATISVVDVPGVEELRREGRKERWRADSPAGQAPA